MMGLSEGTRALGMPLVMLPPGTEPRDVPGRHETRAEGVSAAPPQAPVPEPPRPAGPPHLRCLSAEGPPPLNGEVDNCEERLLDPLGAEAS